MRNWIEFDGEDSRDYGVYVNGSGTYNAPEREYDMVSIPGRNGDLINTGNRLQNLEVTYPAFIYTNFKENLAKFRDMLLGKIGYKRLIDSYHPDEFRRAVYTGGLEVDARPRNDAGEFDVTFNCMPQRFLLSGEESQTIGEWGETETQTGDIVTVENPDGDIGFKEVVANLSPIQSLNGYTKPWVGGAGKNKLKPQTPATITNNGVTFTLNADGTVKANGTASGVARMVLGTATLTAGTQYILTGGISAGKMMQLTDYPVVTDKGFDNGSGRQFTAENITYAVRIHIASGVTVNNEVFYPMIRLASETDATFEPYENICPISGHTSVTANRTGKNLFNAPTSGGRTNSGITWVYNADGTLTATGTATGNSWSYIASLSETVLPAGTYTVSVSSPFGLVVRKDNVVLYNGSNNTYTFTLEESATIETYARIATGTTVNNATTGIMLERGSTATAYEPYQGDIYTVSLSSAGTVYGGTLDVVSGKLRVDRAIVTLDGTTSGSINWNGFLCNLAVGGLVDTTRADLVICSHAESVSNYDFNHYQSVDGVIAKGTGAQLRFRNLSIEQTVAGYQAYFAQQANNGTPVQVCYKLATPQTYDLTPQDVTALIGENNLWNSEGETTVVYGEDANGAFNPTEQTSQPLIRVYGYGTLQVGSITVTIANYNKPYIDIDCEMMDCYYGSDNLNQYVTFSGLDFPVFESGLNRIKYSGNITKVEVKGRWWRV